MKKILIRMQFTQANAKALLKALKEITRQNPVFSGVKPDDALELNNIIERLKDKLATK